MNVLLVDDTWGNLFALSQLFKKLNHKFRMKIDQLSDGDVAVEDFMNRNRQKSEDNIHLIVTDKNMNNMDGDQVAREIRALVKD
jgi:CheY-like chemotaxis protein